MVNRDGTNVRRITDHPADDRGPSLSPSPERPSAESVSSEGTGAVASTQVATPSITAQPSPEPTISLSPTPTTIATPAPTPTRRPEPAVREGATGAKFPCILFGARTVPGTADKIAVRSVSPLPGSTLTSAELNTINLSVDYELRSAPVGLITLDVAREVLRRTFLKLGETEVTRGSGTVTIQANIAGKDLENLSSTCLRVSLTSLSKPTTRGFAFDYYAYAMVGDYLVGQLLP